MEPFATSVDLARGWRELSADEMETADELLLRATAQLTSMLAKRHIAIDPADEVQATNLRTVCCNMVRRSMGPSAADGISSMSQTIGSTTAAVTWGNPDGAFYLSKLDRSALGLSAGGGGRVIHHATTDLGGAPC